MTAVPGSSDCPGPGLPLGPGLRLVMVVRICGLDLGLQARTTPLLMTAALCSMAAEVLVLVPRPGAA